MNNSELLEANENLEIIFNTSPDAVLITRVSDGFVLRINDGFTALTGYTRAEMTGKSTLHLNLWKNPEERQKLVAALNETGVCDNLETVLIRKNGSEFTCIISARLITLQGVSHIISITRDITERKQIEMKLQISESQKNAILNGIKANIAFVDKDLKIIWANKTAADSVNRTPDEMIGRTCHHFWAGSQTPCTNCPSLKAMMSKKSEHTIMYTPDGRIWDEGGEPIFDPDGNLIGIVEIATDITESKKLESELRISLTKYEALFNIFPIGITISDTTGQIIESNQIAETLLGISREEQEKRLIDGEEWRIIRPDGSIMPNSEYASVMALREGHPVENVVMGIVKDKSRVEWINVSAAAIPLEGYGVAIVYNDITEQKQSENALRESEIKYRLLTENAADVIWVLNLTTGKFTYISPSVFQLRGFTAEEAMKERLEDSLTPDSIAVVMNAIAKNINDFIAHPDIPKYFINEVQQYCKNGQVIWVEVSTQYRYSPTGDIEVLGVSRNIEERKKSEETLLKAKHDAEMANKAKSIFLANMSHEIRTPLNAIIGFSQLINRDQGLSETQREYNVSIIRAGEHLLSLINDILELSKVEAGRTMLNPAHVDLQSLLTDIHLIFKERAQSKHIQFVFETSDNLPRFVIVDESKLRQIFINLIGNAIKFTDEGCVTVRTCYDKVNERESFLRVEIKDSGSGIAEIELNTLFKHFVQTSTGIKKGSGTGLGLALSRELAILMGGDITVESEVGKGSTFNFHVEIKEGQMESVETDIFKRVVSIDKGVKTYRIMVADDKPENLKVAVTLLKMVGFETIEAVNGEDAIEKFNEYLPDLILMDLRMPVMDGSEAIRRIKATEKGADTPIVALTAGTFESDRKSTESLGIQGYICKPFRENELFATIGKILGITYTYKDETLSLRSMHQRDAEIIAADIRKLPENLHLKMLEALAVADITQFMKLVDSVGQDYPELAQLLLTLAKNYDYDYLKKILTTSN